MNANHIIWSAWACDQGIVALAITKQNGIWNALDEIRDSLKSAIITLDNGCYLGASFEGKGCLTALEMVSGHLYLQDNCEGSY